MSACTPSVNSNVMQQMVNNMRLSLIALPVFLSLGGCYGSSTYPTTLTLAVADTPVDGAESVTLAFTGVQVQPAHGAVIEYDYPTTQLINLLQLQDDNYHLLLDDLEVPAGVYVSIRMLVDMNQSSITLSDGSVHPLVLQGTDQVGILVLHSFSLTDQEKAGFIVDFDLRKSISLVGGLYDFQPALRFIDGSNIGEIEGTVSSDLALGSMPVSDPACQPAAYIYSGNVTPTDINPTSNVQPVSTATVSLNNVTGEYFYESEYLSPGNYTVAITCAAMDNPATVDVLTFSARQQASVVANEETEVDF